MIRFFPLRPSNVRRAFAGLSILACFAAFAPALRAEDIYIAQAAQGSDSGVDAANAHSVDFFNTAKNWSSPKIAGKIGPGDTVHLVGTITDSLVVQGSGNEGHPITVLFDIGAKMTAPYWADPAIKITKKHYITIDGGATGIIGGPDSDPAHANGLIECTDNGTELGHQVNSVGVGATECKNLTVKNLIVSNMYVRTRGPEQNSYGIGISNADTNSNGVSNFSVTNCIIHDAYIGVNSDYSTGDNTYEFSYITAYNCNWGGRCGDRNAASTMNGLSVHHNRFYGWTNWDDTAKNSFHHNGFFAWAMSGGSITNIRYYNNLIGPNYSIVNADETSRANHSTSGLFIRFKN